MHTTNPRLGPTPLPRGTKVVTHKTTAHPNGRTLHPRGAVAIVVKAAKGPEWEYRLRFPDGIEETLMRDDFEVLSYFKTRQGAFNQAELAGGALYDRVIYRCVIGSQAYGLANSNSDVDRRGVYLAPAELHWSLNGVPAQLECDATQETYWELQKFLWLALKANPNVLECLFSPLIETATPLAESLLRMKSCFLSRLVYQTYNGYAMSKFKKMQSDIRNQGTVKWKHVMHLLRLLISGIHVLREGVVAVGVEEHRERLLAIKRGEVSWNETEKWRLCLNREFDDAYRRSKLPEHPDYQKANAFLIRARRAALAEELP